MGYGLRGGVVHVNEGQAGRGERDSASVTHQSPGILLVNRTPPRDRSGEQSA